jgi:cellulose synthase/poly-beta-1,6-N-acetylglucosamine synthase-like glycosyltransferase
LSTALVAGDGVAPAQHASSDATSDAPHPELSLIIVSFNTCDLLRECLTSTLQMASAFTTEIFVVDNASRDGSAEMVAQDFPSVRLLRTAENVGFGRANNLALQQARGRYVVLLNSDAFLQPGSLEHAVAHMDETPRCAAGGARLISRDGSPQPSARMFHTVLNDALVLSGLAHRFPRSRFFGRLDRTWSDLSQPASVDWIPGAFAILETAATRSATGPTSSSPTSVAKAHGSSQRWSSPPPRRRLFYGACAAPCSTTANITAGSPGPRGAWNSCSTPPHGCAIVGAAVKFNSAAHATSAHSFT